MPLEYRSFQIGEVREADGRKIVTGYATRFNMLSHELWDGVRERILPGAVDIGQKRHDVKMFWAHDSSKPITSRDAGGLLLSTDEKGLAFEADLSGEESWTRDAWSNIRRGVTREMSIGFSVPQGGRTVIEEKSGGYIIELREIDLWEISPVSFPAYPGTAVDARGDDAGISAARAAVEEFAQAKRAGKASGVDLLALRLRTFRQGVTCERS